jgi:hypothetical protein
VNGSYWSVRGARFIGFSAILLTVVLMGECPVRGILYLNLIAYCGNLTGSTVGFDVIFDTINAIKMMYPEVTP